ncbi:4-demethylwyosine synthase TYW1 [archaeon]|nr:4-demethylwyosine synthase TYW1 [archaeon]|tara:strand:- start:183 stop:1139 length:957 start_codon:yes stop_codon:yes gene_type:complete
MEVSLAKKILEKQGYRFVGNHSVVKVCHYTKSSIKGKHLCYKNKFYGIQSHRCAQMSPQTFCNNTCDFCWRDIETSDSITMDNGIDDPDEIIDRTIEEQNKLLNGFKGSNIKLDKYLESKKIKHFAISATGEPTIYPKLGKLIKKLRKRNITSYLVSNGQFPDAIEKLYKENSLPTQLYVSLDAPNEKLYKKIDHPITKDYWERFNKTLEILKKIKGKTRTVLRITAVKDLNMCNEKEYCKLIKKADSMFLEVKGYSWLGASKARLGRESVPSFKEIKSFSEKISKELNWKIVDYVEESRVCLIMKEDSKERFIQIED